MRLFLVFAALPAMLLMVSCSGKLSEEEVRDLVKRYAASVSEAYRRLDVTVVDDIVAPNSVEGRRLTGLIGVRMDSGVTMDAELLTVDIVTIKQTSEQLSVKTKETWHYVDRRIGTGKQVGEDSTDSYELLYTFNRVGKVWMVAETTFTAPPEVGRKTKVWGVDRNMMRTFTPKPEGDEDKNRKEAP